MTNIFKWLMIWINTKTSLRSKISRSKWIVWQINVTINYSKIKSESCLVQFKYFINSLFEKKRNKHLIVQYLIIWIAKLCSNQSNQGNNIFVKDKNCHVCYLIFELTLIAVSSSWLKPPKPNNTKFKWLFSDSQNHWLLRMPNAGLEIIKSIK